MTLSNSALTVLEKRYLQKDADGNSIETVEELFGRVAKAVAAADNHYLPDSAPRTEKKFFEMISNLEFLPNSPTLMNAGRPLGQLAACFVLPVQDTMEDIFDSVRNAALIHKSGGGTGFSFSRLRPKGASVHSTGGIASGPVSFMKVFNAATEAVKQGGTRRGANMGILRVDHPDILEFIDCKRINTEITNFNISVGITNRFMEALDAGTDYPLIDPHSHQTTGKLSANEVFDKIVQAAWSNGEPGIIFLDRLNETNVLKEIGEIESTNPCGEQPLLPYEACNLGSINLLRMLKSKGKATEIDWDKLKRTTENAVHFLDNVIDINQYPLEQIEKTTRASRKIGLGVMGFADMLLELGIPYESDAGVEIGGKVMQYIDACAKDASAELAKTRGAFPLFAQSTLRSGRKLRNATLTTIAPTGTISMIAGCSSGIEPVFAFAYMKNVMDGTHLVETNDILQKHLIKLGLDREDIHKKIVQSGTIAHLSDLPATLRSVFQCAHDITPAGHIKMQAAFQAHTDNAVSKTVNFPSTATQKDVYEVYTRAYRSGCKGVTIYRDGSRDGQVLNIGTAAASSDHTHNGNVHAPLPRPEIVKGFTERVKIGCGNLYVTVNFDKNRILEVFTNTGKAGGCPSQSEATARLTSVSLRSGVDARVIIEQLKGIRCPSTIRQPGLKVTSCPDAIGRILEKVQKMIDNSPEELDSLTADVPVSEAVLPRGSINYCPECGYKVDHEGGCVTCKSCGYSKCG